MKWYAYVSIMLGPAQIIMNGCVFIVLLIVISFGTASEYVDVLLKTTWQGNAFCIARHFMRVWGGVWVLTFAASLNMQGNSHVNEDSKRLHVTSI